MEEGVDQHWLEEVLVEVEKLQVPVSSPMTKSERVRYALRMFEMEMDSAYLESRGGTAEADLLPMMEALEYFLHNIGIKSAYKLRSFRGNLVVDND